jgi:hypothetical protein
VPSLLLRLHKSGRSLRKKKHRSRLKLLQRYYLKQTLPRLQWIKFLKSKIPSLRRRKKSKRKRFL